MLVIILSRSDENFSNEYSFFILMYEISKVELKSHSFQEGNEIFYGKMILNWGTCRMP